MAGEGADVIARGENQIHGTSINRHPLLAEYGVGHGKAFAFIKQEPAIGGVSFAHEGGGVFELAAAQFDRKPVPNALALGEKFKPLPR